MKQKQAPLFSIESSPRLNSLGSSWYFGISRLSSFLGMWVSTLLVGAYFLQALALLIPPEPSFFDLPFLSFLTVVFFVIPGGIHGIYELLHLKTIRLGTPVKATLALRRFWTRKFLFLGVFLFLISRFFSPGIFFHSFPKEPPESAYGFFTIQVVGFILVTLYWGRLMESFLIDWGVVLTRWGQKRLRRIVCFFVCLILMVGIVAYGFLGVTWLPWGNTFQQWFNQNFL